MKKSLLSLVSVLFLNLSLCSAPYDVLIDPDFSPYSGGQDLLTGFKLLQVSEDLLIPPKEDPKEGGWTSLGRFAELFLFWNPLGQLATVTQHEVFGHGYRIRDLPSRHAKVTGYQIGWPFPYALNDVGGATGFEVSDRITVAELNAISIAGIEAQDILARQLKMKWLSDQRIDARTSQLYYLSQQSLLFYALSSHHHELSLHFKGVDEDPFSGDDLKSYVFWMNRLYPDDEISISHIRDQSYLNLLDVFTYYSAYSWWYYILTGKQMDLPMLKIGKVGYLPGFKITLAPYGLEKNFENYLTINGVPLFLYVKWGEHGGVGYYGGGVDYDQLFSWKGGIFGFKLDFWYQPNFLQSTRVFDVLMGENAAVEGLKNRRLGVAFSLISRWYLAGSGVPFFLYTEAGYKSKGYLPGYSLWQGFVGRAGLTAKF